MPAITTLPTNIFHDPTLINYTINTTIAATSNYFIRFTTSSADLTLTVPSYKSYALHNNGTNRAYIQGTDVSPVTLEAGQMGICSWDVQNGRHYTTVLDAGTPVDSAMSDSSTNTVQNKVIKAYVDAGLSSSNERVVVGTGIDDNSLVAAAVAELNALSSGTLIFEGSVVINGSHRFTKPINLKWRPGAVLTQKSTSATDGFIWEPSANYNPFSVSAKIVTPMTVTGGHNVTVDNVTGISEGDWIGLYSDDSLLIADQPSLPHDLHATTGAWDPRPFELHQVAYIEGTTIWTADPIIDKFSVRPRLIKMDMVRGIKIDGGEVLFTGATQANYASMFKFNGCSDVTITGITAKRFSPGNIWTSYCANVLIDGIHIGGNKSSVSGNGSLVYANTAITVNNYKLVNSTFEGTRHVFTTGGDTTTVTARKHSNGAAAPITVQSDGTTFTSNINHELQVGDVIRFFDKKGLGSNINDWVTNGLSVAPYYVKTVPAANTFTISATDGGATVTTTAISSPEAILFMCRYGTPLNVTIANNTAHGPLNVNAGGGAGDVARIVFHTHPEGYGVAFLNNTITVTVQNASVGSAAFSCLSRSTKIMNNVLLGNFATPFASHTTKDFIGIEYSGNDTIIQGNVIEGFGVAISTRNWWGAAVGGANATGGKRANISNNVIRNINYAVFWAVDVTGGTSALGSNLVFHNNLLCGTIHYSNAGAAAQIAILCPGMINTRWTNNYIEKMYASVDLMNTSTITDTQIAIAGNTFDGWGSAIGSDEMNGTNSAAIASTWTARNWFIY